MAWSGIKGVFTLLLASDIHNLAVEKTDSPQMVGRKIFSHDYSYSFL